MFDFDDLFDADGAEIGGGSTCAAALRAVWWLNLERRQDRRKRHQAALAAAGLAGFAERIEAVDGLCLDLDGLDQTVISRGAVREAQDPPPRVQGVHMTRGAVGLMLSWHSLLRRIVQEDPSKDACYLIVEDDAVYCENFQQELQVLLEEIESFDPQWEALQVGFFADERKIEPLSLDAAEGSRELQRAVRPVWACGTAGILVHGAQGASRLLEVLFPVRPAQQLDTALSYKYKKLRMYMSKEPLVLAQKSGEGDTDIQIIPQAEVAPEALPEAEVASAAFPEVPLRELAACLASASSTADARSFEANARSSESGPKHSLPSWEQITTCRFFDLRYCLGFRPSQSHSSSSRSFASAA